MSLCQYLLVLQTFSSKTLLSSSFSHRLLYYCNLTQLCESHLPSFHIKPCGGKHFQDVGLKILFQFRLYIRDIILHVLFSARDSTYWSQSTLIFDKFTLKFWSPLRNTFSYFYVFPPSPPKKKRPS